MSEIKTYIAVITFYGPDGKTLAVRYDRWSGNREYCDLDRQQIIANVESGVWGERLAEFAKKHGCVIQAYECKEVDLCERPT